MWFASMKLRRRSGSRSSKCFGKYMGSRSLLRDGARQHLVATITYQDVLLDANAAEAAQRVDAGPDDGIAVLAANLRLLEHVRRKVDPWLNSDDVPRLQRQIDSQEPESGCLGA